MSDFDVLVVGAGHNALVCAGYLAQAGYRVGVAERRPLVGGAVVTEEILPGYRFDLGGSAHTLIAFSPIVRDLELARYGLEYISLDPLFFAPFPDGTHLLFWRKVAQTCESIARLSPRDADAYFAFVEEWQPFARALIATMLSAPTPLNLARYLGWAGLSHFIARPAHTALLRDGYARFLRQTFADPRVQGTLAWSASQSGLPPDAGFSAIQAVWQVTLHLGGIRVPRGGSGMLTQALQKMIEAHQGTVLTNTPVRRILVRDGRAVGIVTEGGESLTARALVSGTHIRTTLQLLGEAAPPKVRRAVEKKSLGNGLGMSLRCALKELPDYSALPGQPGLHHGALQHICPSPDYLERAYADFRAGGVSREPALTAMTFSACDPTLAPAGRHVMSLWAQYHPYQLGSNESWDEIGPRTADRLLDKLAEYAPNIRGAVIDRLVESPLDFERTLGLWRGNIVHLEMTPGQMLALRPTLGLHNYRGPVKSLYLTGASMHPGGGISGIPGRHTAAVVLNDLSRRN